MGNHRVQIFDSNGSYQRQFGSKGHGDGQFDRPLALASDVHGNALVADYCTERLQVFNSKGEHVCTRSDLGLHRESQGGYGNKTNCGKAIAWGATGQLAVGEDTNFVRVWAPGGLG